MKHTWIFAMLFILGCSEKAANKRLEYLSGYWEIEKAEFPDGKIRRYNVSQTIDYFELNPDSTGFRKKLQPRLNGRFLATDHTERFEIKTEGKQLKIHYRTAMDQWKEIILEIDKDRLTLKNDGNLTYFYKRFKAIDTEP